MSDAAAAEAPALPGGAGAASAEGPLDRLEIDGEPAPAPAGDEPVTDADVAVGPAPSAGPGDPAPAVPLPGAYVPPSLIQRPMPAPPPVQMPMASSPSVGAPPPASTAGWTPPSPIAPPLAPPDAPVSPGRASLFADLPFDAPDSVTEWMVAIGSSAAAISFLLPWISGTTSYLTSWGLGSASRLPILAVLIATAVLGILPNRVALWVRAGVLGLIGGSVFLGNLWPIVAGDFGDAAFGAVIGAAAAIVLIVGGILGVAPRRPEAEDR